MALPWLAIIAKNIPWGEIVKRTPDIIAASRNLLEKTKKSGSEPTEEGDGETSEEKLRRRVESLEAQDQANARLIAQIVEQMLGLTDGLEVLAARNRLLTWLVAGLVLALLIVVFALS